MLVPTMTPEEIYAEMYKDAEWLEDKINCKLTLEAMKLAKRAKRFPWHKVYVVKSEKTQISYNVIFLAHQRGDWNRLMCIIYTKYSHESGKTLIYLERKRFAIRIYTPHFLQRYKERQKEHVEKFQDFASLDIEFFFLLRNWEVAEMTLFKSFIDEDPNSFVAQKIKEMQNRTKFWQDSDYERYSVACIMGMCLCERHKQNKNISIFDTFISPDLLKGEQFLDFIPAYAQVLLNAIVREYPRQRELISREWEHTLESSNDVEDKPLYIIDKLEELSTRYPISAIF